MDLPEDKGTYILIVSVTQMKRLPIGRLGTFDINPGFYAYVGSAFGPGGLRASVSHHLESIAEPHWHIDYLVGLGQPVEVWYAISDRKLEGDWVELLSDAAQFRTPIPRFGSSDYRRSRTSHLFHAKRRPSFGWFKQQTRQTFEPEVQPRQFILAPAAPRSDGAGSVWRPGLRMSGTTAETLFGGCRHSNGAGLSFLGGVDLGEGGCPPQAISSPQALP